MLERAACELGDIWRNVWTSIRRGHPVDFDVPALPSTKSTAGLSSPREARFFIQWVPHRGLLVGDRRDDPQGAFGIGGRIFTEHRPAVASVGDLARSVHVWCNASVMAAV